MPASFSLHKPFPILEQIIRDVYPPLAWLVCLDPNPESEQHFLCRQRPGQSCTQRTTKPHLDNNSSSKSSNTAITLTALSPDCLLGKPKETLVPEFKELICLHLHELTSTSQRGVSWHGFQSNLHTLKAQLSSSAQIPCKSVRSSPYISLCASLKACRVEDWIGISLQLISSSRS